MQRPSPPSAAAPHFTAAAFRPSSAHLSAPPPTPAALCCACCGPPPRPAPQVPDLLKKECLLFYYPDCELLAQRIKAMSEGRVELAEITWK